MKICIKVNNILEKFTSQIVYVLVSINNILSTINLVTSNYNYMLYSYTPTHLPKLIFDVFGHDSSYQGVCFAHALTNLPEKVIAFLLIHTPKQGDKKGLYTFKILKIEKVEIT